MGAEPAPGVSEAMGARLRPEERILLQELESANSINEAQVLVETQGAGWFPLRRAGKGDCAGQASSVFFLG
jgi:hypothetical protein